MEAEGTPVLPAEPSAGKQVRHGLLYALPTIVGVGLPLLTLPLFSRALTTAEYGTLALATAYGLFASGVANLGLPLTYERNFFQYTERGAAARLLYSIVAFVLVFLVAIGVATWVWRDALSMALTKERGHGTILFVSYVSFSLQSLKLYFLTYFKNDGDARSFVRYSLDETLLWTALSLLFVVVLRMGAIGMPLGQLVGGGVIVLLLGFRFLRRMPAAFDRGLLSEAVRMSLPLTPRLFITVVSNNFDKFIIGALGTMGGVGVYSIGQKVALVVFGVMTAFQNVFSPVVYRRLFAGGEQAESIGRYLTPFAYASVAVALLAAMFSEEALHLLTPPEYHGAAIIVNVLAMYYAIMFFTKQPQLLFAKKPGLVSIISAVSMGLYIAMTLLFVARWGAVGAAWGTLFAGILSTIITVGAGQRFVPIHYEVSRIASMYGILALAAVILFVLDVSGAGYPARLAWKVVALAGFVGLGVRLGYLSAGSVRAAQAWIGGRLGLNGAVTR